MAKGKNWKRIYPCLPLWDAYNPLKSEPPADFHLHCCQDSYKTRRNILACWQDIKRIFQLHISTAQWNFNKHCSQLTLKSFLWLNKRWKSRHILAFETPGHQKILINCRSYHKKVQIPGFLKSHDNNIEEIFCWNKEFRTSCVCDVLLLPSSYICNIFFAFVVGRCLSFHQLHFLSTYTL